MNGDVDRARLALEGLSLGDAFGERFFAGAGSPARWIEKRELPPPTWAWTDDTAMARSVVRILERHERIDRDALAAAFAAEWRREPARGYGAGAHQILGAISTGVPWKDAAGSAFGGAGSMGNGAAMRAAPIGAFHGMDLARVVVEADRSAQVTHSHPDGRAGAIAVAVAASNAWIRAAAGRTPPAETILELAVELTPESPTREGLVRARSIPLSSSPRVAAAALGTGGRVLSQDTVPWALWCAARHLDDFEEAMWTTVSGFGDRDTTCAIVGGIVALSVGREGLPAEWLAAREPI